MFTTCKWYQPKEIDWSLVLLLNMSVYRCEVWLKLKLKKFIDSYSIAFVVLKLI